MKRKEEIIYSELQDAKVALRKALEDILRLDEELGGTDTYRGEIMPVIVEVLGDGI